MAAHVRLTLVLGAVVSVTGCVNESNFRKHLYFPWPCTMIRQRRMRNLRVVCSPRIRPHSRQGELRGDHVSTVWRSRIRAATRGTRYSIALRHATKPRVTVLAPVAQGDQERFPSAIRAPGRLRRRGYQPFRQLHI